MIQLNTQTLALMKLLEDPDHVVFENIKEKLCSYGEAIIPELLLKKTSNHADKLLSSRIDFLVNTINFSQLRRNLSDWKEKSVEDLLKGALIVCRYAYPHLDEADTRARLDKIAAKVKAIVNLKEPVMQQVATINKVLYKDFKLTPNLANFYSPENYYLNTVLKEKKGSPVLLSMIYSYVAQHAGIPIYGINLPQHFVVGYVGKHISLSSREYCKEKVLFYINPFNKGLTFSLADIDIYLNQLSICPKKEYYQPCSNIHIIKRVLRSLSGSYDSLNEFSKGKELKELMSIL